MLLAATDSALLMLSVPPFPVRRFVDGPGIHEHYAGSKVLGIRIVGRCSVPLWNVDGHRQVYGGHTENGVRVVGSHYQINIK